MRRSAVIWSSQQGVALIMVLIIVALVTIIATQLVTERNLQARRTSNIILADNAWQFALGAETLAGIGLVNSLKNQNTVHLNQVWASEGIVFPIDGGSLSAEMKDLRSCFNLNGLVVNISNPPKGNNVKLPGEKIFAELVTLLKIDAVITPEALAARLRDWIDNDQTPSGIEGREDYEYSGYTQPYRTGDSLLGSSTELSTVSGFNPDIVARLLPYVCFIPNVTELVLNINTIADDQPELLSSFYDKLDVNAAANILTARPEEGYDLNSYNKQLPAIAKLHSGAQIEFSSPYFSVTAKVTLGRARVNLKSLLKYDKQANDIIVLARLGIND
ncbi:MAG: type II secretion system minor pseudopilin GspK [Gammaproteobacteria bacterium]|nr:type II secretion system minor pseudopilin GspK [Gammaproteobacteria bacterium]